MLQTSVRVEQTGKGSNLCEQDKIGTRTILYVRKLAQALACEQHASFRM